MSQYTIHSVERTGAGPWALHDLTAQEFQNDMDLWLGQAAGAVSPTLAVPIQRTPKYPFSATQLTTALTAIGMAGSAIATDTPFKAYFAKWDSRASQAASGHELITISEGFIVPMSLVLSQGTEPAALDFMLHILELAAGGTPIAHTTGATLPTLDAVDEAFTLGDVYYNTGTQIPDVSQVSIEFGLETEVIHRDGRQYPKSIFIMRIVPKIVVTMDDIATARLLGSATHDGVPYTTELTVFARKLSPTTGVVIDVTAEHIKFVAEGWHARVTGGLGGAAQEHVKPQVTFEALKDGANAPLVITTDVAIAAPA